MKQTLQEALREFAEWGNTKYAVHTVETYTDFLERFIVFAGNKKISETDITDVNRYFTCLKNKNYHESSIALMMVSIRQFFRFLFLRRLVKWDFQLIGVPKYISRPHTPIETEEARSMLKKIRIENFLNLRDKTILSFLYSSGLRVSELCDLKLEDLFLEKRYGLIYSKKNLKRRMIFWSEETDKFLKEYLEYRKRCAKTNYVFVSYGNNYKGGKITARTVERIVAKYRDKGDITPHSFRHGLGMRAVRSGIHPRHIMEILGHKNITSSQVYMQIQDKDVVNAYNSICG